jgi:hypothetical protein
MAFTPDDYARWAAALWAVFTPAERRLTSLGIFPAEKMALAESEGYATHPLVVALMNHARNNRQPMN